ncbi:bifunctional adenosylcobinamide kinase/adenosylcobinamide-phosphate guanylyltransferase [cf. Phormidesmis sp. LEGE 11477]|uniref:bifunctional adenosylcobinamide kinase/adenosylcobinamide-phosphate guanylyltransferase n=1 Tax=cf. Phormidesmis sp. LEGE 11477 TaxID=1828680 RepID=UPI001880CF4F|nr:bifunctional adenosylcobinamide kinase/adenosylcobinamide-phosphate guanylyltransferase [cf. Phormidesmis sp. LEGE 11477]MBE9060799.1 bifunctional adenosylcobinamide kinase/adenosylcobinamide-phosphate guanylyltransferase [cf. Phormidesmis sp. LEGE 11477]
MSITLITGPSRSGKSEWAERLADQSATRNQQQVVYIATAQTSSKDAEWQRRIEKHRTRRPVVWQTEEVPLALADAILLSRESVDSKVPPCLLIDSLGTWLANLIEQDDDSWESSQQALIEALKQTEADVILVAEETGWGVVPAYASGRRFRDRLGDLSRAIGQISTEVYLVTGGYAISLKQLGIPING